VGEREREGGCVHMFRDGGGCVAEVRIAVRRRSEEEESSVDGKRGSCISREVSTYIT